MRYLAHLPCSYEVLGTLPVLYEVLGTLTVLCEVLGALTVLYEVLGALVVSLLAAHVEDGKPGFNEVSAMKRHVGIRTAADVI